MKVRNIDKEIGTLANVASLLRLLDFILVPFYPFFSVNRHMTIVFKPRNLMLIPNLLENS